MENTCTEGLLGAPDFPVTVYFYPPGPVVSQRAPSPPQGSFLTEPREKQGPGHLFLSEPENWFWIFFSVPVLWTDNRTYFSCPLGIGLRLQKPVNILMTLFGYP